MLEIFKCLIKIIPLLSSTKNGEKSENPVLTIINKNVTRNLRQVTAIQFALYSRYSLILKFYFPFRVHIWSPNYKLALIFPAESFILPVCSCSYKFQQEVARIKKDCAVCYLRDGHNSDYPM